MNIRTRLTLLFTLLVASIMLLFSLSIYYLYNQHRENEFQQRLESKAIRTGQLGHRAEPDSGDELANMIAGQVLVYDQQDREVYRSKPTNPIFSLSAGIQRQVREGRLVRMRQDTLEAVAVCFSANGQSYVAVASGYDRLGFNKLDRLRQILFFGWLLSLVVVGVAGWLFASDALRPVAELIEQAKAISATNIHRRLRVGRQRDELSLLAVTFNDMLQRLEEAFVSQKSFVSHASHELRTPLTIMMSQVEVALMQTRTQAEYKESLDELLDTVKGMIGLVNGLIELVWANSDAVTLTYQSVRVDELLWQARANIIAKRPHYQIDIDFENMPDQEEDLMLPGEGPLLTRAFQNLMENGCKYSPENSVTVILAFMPYQMRVSFVDQGVGIPAVDLPHIFEPFYRADNVMAIHGYGIGLALTQRIVDLHRASIQVDSAEKKGTMITVIFPLHQPVPPMVMPLMEEAA